MKRTHHTPAPYTRNARNPWKGLISPDGTTYRNIPDLQAFCKAHQLDYALIYRLCQWEIEDVHGWTRMS